MHDANSFLTLTYDDGNLPANGSLLYRDHQLFFKSLRKHFSPTLLRFFMCGEYGTTEIPIGQNVGRPHFHTILFGGHFEDRVVAKRSKGFTLYSSRLLEKLWKRGLCWIGDVSFESAAYVARYVVDKITGEAAEPWYQRMNFETGEISELEPEFCHMSLKPGIGHDWLRLYWPEVIQGGTVIARGHESRAPKYYDKLLRRLQAYEDVEYRRYVKARLTVGENSDERLAVQEQVVRSRLSLSKRK